jgi:hypothetical protein
MPGFPFAQQPKGADHVTMVILDPEMQRRGLRVAGVDVRIRAVLLDDEHVLTHGEDPEQRPRRQLVEMRCADLGHARVRPAMPPEARPPRCTQRPAEQRCPG